ncbi:plasma serine protease inhibitor isoform X2 [Fukomys damarensis]|uniref:Plasma serine protease inhibitor n=2 Tax=Fukomys damarensis TaxID=885580 RepID=A0A091CUK9_FUKDA|nr:plasma serine protease inhibitor isoform X2 [Fukomys damarensis]KFO21355.1 Plasma serine protease inhibitor [Fukomys damarensis]
MQLFLLLCLALLSPQVATSRRFRAQKKQPKEPSTRDFAFDLYRALASSSPTQNVFFSPLSVSTILAILSVGARGNTQAQILEALGFDPQHQAVAELHYSFRHLLVRLTRPGNGFKLSLGNALFIDDRLVVYSIFQLIIMTTYLANIYSTHSGDPAAAQKQINDYLARQTQGKIVDLIQNLDSTDIMVMVNYIFFKAKWEIGFNNRTTQDQDFYLTLEKKVQVPMMNHEDQYLYFLDRYLSCTVVGVPYEGNVTAYFILPNIGKMEQVENSLSTKTLKKWTQTVRRRRLNLYLPKFSIEGSYHLEKIFPKLGIRDIFTQGADLSGISKYPNIQLSQMVHKAMVEVDESGTRAVSGTGTVFSFRSAYPNSRKITFNRPFLMAILENMTTLFFGKVTQP